MLKPPLFGSPFRRVRHAVLTASILPAALATQAWAVDWNGPVTIAIDPTVAVGLVEGKADGLPFDLLSANVGDGPGRDVGFPAGVSLGIFMGQETANFAESTTADFDNFWFDNRTWIYTGEINSGPNGLLSFAESIDDATQIMIDGVVVLRDEVWNVPTATGVLQFTPNTYHTIEIRMGNGVGGAGPVSLNNFVANVPTDPPTANGYGFGFSHTGATGTNGANYIKPIDPGTGTLFQHETIPAAAAGQDINVLGDSQVTLNKITNDHITENSITFAQAAAAVTLAVNGSTPGGTLRSLGTVLATANTKTVTISGNADFAPGALSTGPNPGEATLTGVILQKNGGTGQLILDNPTNALLGTTLKVIDGTVSIVGGGGTMNPVSSLTTAIDLGGTTTGLTPVLRLGGGITGTDFVNRIFVRQNGTIEHVSPGTDSITTPASGSGPALGMDLGRTLTVNVSNGGLNVNGLIARSNNVAAAGGPLVKKGVGTLRLNGTDNLVTGITADEGRLEVTNRIRTTSGTLTVNFGATGTLALLNTSTTNWNRLPTTITVPTGTLEGVPGAFTNGSGVAPLQSAVSLTGGALTLGPGFSVSPNGLIANLYNGDAGAQSAFPTYAGYLSYFASKGSGTVTNTAANGYADLAFGLPTGGDPQMFVPIAPTFTATNNIVSRMHGKILITTPGNYTFGAGSDDGSMIYIDGQLVVSNNIYQGHTRRTGSAQLSAGLHDIDIGFYEGGGLNSLVVDWAGPGATGTPIDVAGASVRPIPNTVLVPVPSEDVVWSNPVTVSVADSTINSAAARLPSLSLQVGRTLTVNGYRFTTGPLTLNGGAGTYTFNTNTPFGETFVPSIVDGGAAVAIVKNGPGTLVLEAGASPQLQSATSITATGGGLGIVLGPVSPTGSATLNVNGFSLIVSSKGGDQTLPLPAFSNGGSIIARRIGSGVAGTAETPIVTTLTGNFALNAGTTLNLGTADNYVLAVAGISGNATLNVSGRVETSGVVNVGGPLNVVSSVYTAAQSVSAGVITVTDSTVTANAGISGTSLAINNGTVVNTGNIAAPGGISITGAASVPAVLELNGGSITAGPITGEGGIIHVTSGVTNAATSATFTGLSPSGLFGRFVRRPDGGAGQFWPAQTEGGILGIETDNGPFTVEETSNHSTRFSYQGADATITAFFDGASTEPNQFAIGFFGTFTVSVDGQYQMQVTQVDDDAGWWIDLDNDGVFETGGASGNELIAQQACCGDSAVGSVTLVGGRIYKVGIGVDDGQGGSSLIGMIGVPGEGMQVIDPSNPAQDGWWHYGLPNQVVVDELAELNMEAINGSVNVLANGALRLTDDSSMDSLVIGANGVVTLGGAGPAPAEEPVAGAELVGEPVAVPEPATSALLLFGALSLFRRRRDVRS